MKDRPRPHHGLGSQEQVFDLQQVAISQDRLQRLPWSAFSVSP
jgi:hypothetical protein